MIAYWGESVGGCNFHGADRPCKALKCWNELNDWHLCEKKRISLFHLNKIFAIWNSLLLAGLGEKK